jgi:carbon storage regulator
MLVLSRKVGERIQIGDQITVTVVRINGPNGVRLGIDAPPEMAVVREELAARSDSSLTAAQRTPESAAK